MDDEKVTEALEASKKAFEALKESNDKAQEQLVAQKAVWDTYVPLRSGVRSLPICRRCPKSR